MVYLRRQAIYDKPAEVYISEDSSFCAPYDRWRDYKLPSVIQADQESPVLLTYRGSTLIVHAPHGMKLPWPKAPKSFSVEIDELTPKAYEFAAHESGAASRNNWARVQVPVGNNTCAP